MQRDHRKHLGGMWEASAGGSALQGEKPLECAQRELFEETGVSSGTFEQVWKGFISSKPCRLIVISKQVFI